jgi:hypothetical protein
MKRLLFKIIYLLIFMAGPVAAQPHLRVQSLQNWPDTAWHNLVLPVGAVIENIGNTAYYGPIQVILKTDPTTFSYLYFNTSFNVTLLPGDTVGLYPPSGYLFDSSVFKPGNNVVVVWPHSAQTSVIIDSSYVNLFFDVNTFQGIQQPAEIRNLLIYPNPAIDRIWIESPDVIVERVRILDLSGREIDSRDVGGVHRLDMSLVDLRSGVYLLEVYGGGEKRSIYKLYRSNP